MARAGGLKRGVNESDIEGHINDDQTCSNQ